MPGGETWLSSFPTSHCRQHAGHAAKMHAGIFQLALMIGFMENLYIIHIYKYILKNLKKKSSIVVHDKGFQL